MAYGISRTASPVRIQGSADEGRARHASLAPLAVLATGFLAFLVFLGEFTGTVRWVLGILLVSGIAVLAWVQVSRRASEVPPLVGPRKAGVVREGELAELAAAVRRADGGLLYSQMLVATRARDAFATRTRLVLGLSEDRMREVQQDRAAIGGLVGDPVLEDFLHVRTEDGEERYRWVRQARERGGFDAAFRDVLRRMEAWR